MAKNRIKVGKPTQNNEEAQRQNVLRTIAMKRESYFQLILGNLLRNEAVTHETMVSISGKDGKEHRQVNIIDIVDTALEGSAYIINKMYTAQPEGEEKKEGE